ncbi:MAG: hypothetical protein AM1032_000106 [Mycoplasmataceae bacterium]|nr:MAG: hypothetical protein AM1032_000106 [Mycoplasmataceae bacterium]
MKDIIMKKFLNKKAIKYYLKTFFSTNKLLFIFPIIISIFRIVSVLSIAFVCRNQPLLEPSSTLSSYNKISNLFFWNHLGFDYKLGIQNLINKASILISGIKLDDIANMGNVGNVVDGKKIVILTIVSFFFSPISCISFPSGFFTINIFNILREFFNKIYKEDFLGWNSPENDDKFVILNTNWTRKEIFFSKFISIFLISSLISLYGSLFVIFNGSKLSINVFQAFLYIFLNTFIFNIFSSINEKIITYSLSLNQITIFLAKTFFMFFPTLTSLFLNYLKSKGFFLNLDIQSFFSIIQSLIFSLEIFMLSRYYNEYKKFDFKN